MPYTQSNFLGMDMDTSYTARGDKKYFKLRNGRLMLDEELGVGTISNVDGNVVSFELPDTFNDLGGKGFAGDLLTVGKIVGVASIEDYVVLFCATENSPVTGDDLPPYDQRYGGSIWRFKYNPDDSISGLSGGKLVDTEHLIFYDRLHFIENNYVSVIANSESQNLKKVYFVDGLNVLRVINIIEPQWDVPLNKIEVIADAEFTQPKAHVVDGGSFFVGAVQYAYQQFDYNGSETKFSVCSNLINITKEKYDETSTSEFLGTEYVPNDLPSTKAVSVSIQNLDQRFDSVRLFRIFYNSGYGTPEISILGEFSVSEDLTFVDDGVLSIGTIDYQEFEAFGGTLFSAKDLAVSNKRLVAANIKEDFYNPDYDARAYGYIQSTHDAVVVESGNDQVGYKIRSDGSWDYYVNGSIVDSGFDWAIPENFDSVNVNPDDYKYIAGSSTKLGGTGANVSYTFDIAPPTMSGFGFILDNVNMSKDTGDVLGDFTSSPISVYGGVDGPGGVEREEHAYSSPSDTQTWDQEIDYTFQENIGYSNFASEVNSSQVVGYMPGETYRFGIVLFDKKGRKSPVKWIGDIKFPGIWDIDDGGQNFHFLSTPYVDPVTGAIDPLYGRILYIKFEVNNLPDTVESYQIVRVKRLEKDKTILTAGYITPTFKWGQQFGEDTDDYEWFRPTGTIMRYVLDDDDHDSSGNYNYSTGASGTVYYGERVDYQVEGTNHVMDIYNETLVNFWSPELSFGNDFSFDNARLVIYGKASRQYSQEQSIKYGQDAQGDPDLPYPYITMYKTRYIEPLTGTASYIKLPIDEYRTFKSNPSDTKYEVGGIWYRHVTETYLNNNGVSGNSRRVTGWAGSGAVLNLGENVKDSLAASDIDQYTLLFAFIERDVGVQYSGNTFETRKYNAYIPASNLYKSTDTIANTFGGDVYINMFEHLRIFNNKPDNEISTRKDGTGGDTWSITKAMVNTVVVPSISTINVDWRSDKAYTKNESEYRGAVREDKGVYLDQDGYTAMDTVANLINWTYQRYNDSHQYFEEPLFIDELITDLNHRLIASDTKYDGEPSDSWLKFKVNNVIDVDGTKGPITALDAFSDVIYFFQTEGIGLTRIDERALVNDTEGVSLVLGTGDVFAKPQYLSTNSGVKDIRSVSKGRTGIYFYDYINRTISTVTSNGIRDLAKSKGIKSYIKNNVDKYIETIPDTNWYRNGAVLGYDQTTATMFFTFINQSNEDFTITYSEEAQAFISFMDFIPKNYLQVNKRFLTIPNDEAIDHFGYLHNIGNKGEFYDRTYETILTILVTGTPSYTKVFDALEYTHDADEAINSGIPPNLTDTFSSIRVYNNFLDTGVKAFNPRFRFRTWRAKLPRHEEDNKKFRITGRYAKIELHFDNSNNNPLYLQPMLTFWRPIAFVEH